MKLQLKILLLMALFLIAAYLIIWALMTWASIEAAKGDDYQIILTWPTPGPLVEVR